MNKHLSFLIFFLASYLSFSQCVPNQNQGAIIANPAGSYDMQLVNGVINNDVSSFDSALDTLTAFPHAIAGTNFSADVTIRVPVDTAITYDLGTGSGPQLYEGVNIVSMSINTIQGLPMGFSWECVGGIPDDDPDLGDCAWSGGDFGCIRIMSNGLVDGMLAGNGVQAYPLNVILDVSATYSVFGFPFPVNTQVDDLLDYFVLVVDDGNNVSSAEILDARNFDIISAFPNPAEDYFKIQYGNNIIGDVSFKIYDMLGNVVVSDIYTSQIGHNEIQFDSHVLKSGIYTVVLSNKFKAITERIVIK